MAVTLLFRKSKTKIGALELDATLSEQHRSEVEVTDNPVEKGAAVSDHARSKPDVVTIEGVVSNFAPPSVEAQPQQWTAPNGVTWISRSEADMERAGRAYAELLELKENAQLVQVVTALRTYENMVLVSLDVPRDTGTGKALRFTATFRQIRLVENRRVTVTRTEPKTKRKEDLGSKPAARTKGRSLLKSAKDSETGQAVLGFFGRVGG